MKDRPDPYSGSSAAACPDAARRSFRPDADSCDILIIGAGVVGCAVARTLARCRASVMVVEREADVGFGISSRNSGVVHSGIHYAPGSARARLAVAGNAMMDPLCRELQVPCQSIGKLTVAFSEHERQRLELLRQQGIANGVPDLRILDHAAMEKLQPGIGGIAALHSPSTGIVSPYELTIALAEQAYANGAVFRFCTEVTGLKAPSQPGETYRAVTSPCLREKGQAEKPFQPGAQTAGETAGNRRTSREIRARIVINAAGLGSEAVSRMVGIDEYPIYPCRGEYTILDKRLKDALNLLIYPLPGSHSGGLGIHLTSTTGGVILIGPSNEYIEDREDAGTTREITRLLRKEGHHLLPALESSDFIRSFAGIRPKLAPPEEGGFRDFVIESRPELPGFINLTGIESPGLTAAPAIAEEVAVLVGKMITLVPKPDATAGRPVINGIPFAQKRFAYASAAEQVALVEQDPAYGSIVCRCEKIPLAEIRQAAGRTLGPVTFAGIRYRTRAGMGRCQGGFCLQRLADILERDMGIAVDRQSLKGPSTELFAGRLRNSASAVTPRSDQPERMEQP